MRFDKFTLKVQEALQEAQTLAGSLGHQAIDVEHLLLSFIRQQDGITSEIFKKLGAPLGALEQSLNRALSRQPRVEGVAGGATYITPRLNRVLDQALTEAAQMKDEYVSTEHVLLAMTEEKGGEAGKLLRDTGVNREAILRVLVDIRGSQRITDPNPEEK